MACGTGVNGRLVEIDPSRVQQTMSDCPCSRRCMWGTAPWHGRCSTQHHCAVHPQGQQGGLHTVWHQCINPFFLRRWC